MKMVKLSEETHKELKLLAVSKAITMEEMVSRLLNAFKGSKEDSNCVIKLLDLFEVFPHLASCSNCGNALTEKQIDLAIEDANMPMSEMDCLTLCCPSYTDETGCTGEHGAYDIAYWAER